MNDKIRVITKNQFTSAFLVFYFLHCTSFQTIISNMHPSRQQLFENSHFFHENNLEFFPHK